MDVIAQRVSFLEGLIADRTGIVVQRDVLAHTGCRTELRITGGACV
jgi:hypothetical protein